MAGMGTDDGAAVGRWCILTTASTRTLPLAEALAAAGMRTWTPKRVKRRTGRGKQRQQVVQVDVPITPTFVFVGAEHLADLLRIRAQPACPYPAYRVLRDGDRIPAICDASLGALRAAEERFAHSLLKSTRRHLPLGTSVRMNKGAFAGMTGIVEGSNGKEARVNFGHGFTVSIASYLLGTDVVQNAPQPSGIAA